jgi:TolB protein
MRPVSLVPFVLIAAGLATAADAPLTGKIAYARKEGERYVLHVMNADGTGDKQLPGQTAKLNFLPCVSPDGKRLAYMTAESLEAESFQLVLAAADGTGARTLNTGLELNGMPAWSPNGKQLAFVGGNREQPSVYVADADGNGLRQVSEADKGAMFPFWLNNETLGYTHFEQMEVKSALVTRKPAGGAAQTLTEGMGLMFATAGSVSPDGKQLAYAVLLLGGESSASVRIRDLAANSEATVAEAKIMPANGPDMLVAPAWAPDGKGLVIALPTDKGNGLFYVTPDGKQRRLTPDGVDCASPFWFR